jgi:hypothetical protein
MSGASSRNTNWAISELFPAPEGPATISKCGSTPECSTKLVPTGLKTRRAENLEQCHKTEKFQKQTWAYLRAYFAGIFNVFVIQPTMSGIHRRMPRLCFEVSG